MSTFKARYQHLAQLSRQERTFSFPILFGLFLAGSLMGFVLEGIWHMLRTGVWGFRVATLWGPFCIIYGAGAVTMYLLALRVQHRRPLVQFLAFALIGSAVEYLSSVFQEAVFGTVSWDYSHHPLQLGGRISLRMTLLWGLAGMALMYAVLPPLLAFMNQIHWQNRRTLCRILALLMCFNLLATSVAMLRWQERTCTASPASNAIESWMDTHWPDERMHQRFPNMIFIQQTQSQDAPTIGSVF